jgi:hypothetical protein
MEVHVLVHVANHTISACYGHNPNPAPLHPPTPSQDGGRKVRIEPGLLGGEVNKFLAAYAK